MLYLTKNKNIKFYRIAFTLIELLVVIAIIGILSGLIVVSMSGVTSRANIAKSQVFSNSLRNSMMINTIAQYTFDDIDSSDYDPSTKILNNDAGNVPDSWADNEGRAYHGPIVKEGSECVSGKCLSFDVGDYIYFGNNSSLTFADQSTWTVEYWLAPTDGFWNVLSSFSNSGAAPYIMVPHWDTAAYFKSASNAYTSVYNNSVAVNKWQHIVYSCAGSSRVITIYTDGVKKGTMPPDNSSIAFNYLGTIDGYIGKIDNIRLYNTIVPASLVKEHYYAGINDLFASGNISREEYQEKIKNIAQDN
ncbi:MAG: prepilin-type N-terminal cleavage/methylation domain-containing protein [Candidatus Paceibacterota bacterium]|jgi:prepilin-type N-terminal cleavage/methylation domain-containing protein